MKLESEVDDRKSGDVIEFKFDLNVIFIVGFKIFEKYRMVNSLCWLWIKLVDDVWSDFCCIELFGLGIGYCILWLC